MSVGVFMCRITSNLRNLHGVFGWVRSHCTRRLELMPLNGELEMRNDMLRRLVVETNTYSGGNSN